MKQQKEGAGGLTLIFVRDLASHRGVAEEIDFEV
jgi:hypothetical protein